MRLRLFFSFIIVSVFLACSSFLEDDAASIYSSVIDKIVAPPVPPVSAEETTLSTKKKDSLLRVPLKILISKKFKNIEASSFDSDFVSKELLYDNNLFKYSIRNFEITNDFSGNLNDALRKGNYFAFLQFSRIFYNKNNTEAWVLASIKYERLSSNAKKYLFSRKNGRWILKGVEVIDFS